MDKKPNVSVIVPVYNSSKYLRESLSSLQQQTYQDFEVLLVNDGSTDDSLSICEEFASNDARFKVFSKSNGGVSSARNYGLDKAVGKYVTFMDNDDYVYPDWLEHMAREIGDCDLLICNFAQCNRGGQKCRNQQLRERVVCKTRDDFNRHMGTAIDYFCFGQIWRQLFLKSIIDEHHLKFENIQNEDTLFSYTFFTYVKSVVKTDFQGYCFIHNEGSLGHHHHYIAEYNWIKRMEGIHLSLIKKYDVKNKAYFGRLNNRFAIHVASFLCKGYYKDTKVPYSIRQQRWKTISRDQWFKKLKISDIDSIQRRILLLICRWHLNVVLDPLLSFALKNH